MTKKNSIGNRPPIKLLSTTIALLFTSFNLLIAAPLELQQNTQSQKFKESFSTKLEEIAAFNALEEGFPEIAIDIYNTILSKENTTQNQAQALYLELSTAYIAQDKITEAEQTLKKIHKPSPSFFLNLAITNFQNQNYKKAQENLSEINLQELPNKYHYWYYLTHGLVTIKQPAERSWYGVIKDLITFEDKTNNKQTALDWLQKANLQAKTFFQKSQTEALIFRTELIGTAVDDNLAKEILKKYQSSKGKPERFLFIKEYALALAELNKKEEAINFLDQEIKQLKDTDLHEKPRLLLLLSLITGEGSNASNIALKSLIQNNNVPQFQRIALGIFNSEKNIINNPQSHIDYLTSLINDPQYTSILDSLYFSRTLAFFYLKKFEEASSDALNHIQKFPASEFHTQTLWLLAKIELQTNPPHYRTAANYLNEIKNITSDLTKKTHLTQLIADCYFLNKDFDQAADVYAEILENAPANFPKGIPLLQKICSEIAIKKIDKARATLDKSEKDPSVDSLSRWRAEWNLITALKRENSIETALFRINKKLIQSDQKDFSPELILRLMWLKAQLSLEAKNAATVPELTDNILKRLKKLSSQDLDTAQNELIASHTLLIKGEALLAIDKENEGLKTFQLLRDNYNHTSPALQSYLIEARHFASKNNRQNAQQRLIDLADQYPNSEHAPIALYEAAIQVTNKATTQSYKQALLILERITSNYSQNPLAYYARIKQADILREINDFGAAQLIYENLINQYPNHKEYYFTELARADCLLAQGAKNPSHYKEAEAIYERIYETPSLSSSLRIEAAYKLGFNLLKQSNTRRAKDVFWSIISRFLFQNPSNQNNNQDKSNYWLARSIFELASLLEKEKSFDKAIKVYSYIIDYNLPGTLLAKEKIQYSENQL